MPAPRPPYRLRTAERLNRATERYGASESRPAKTVRLAFANTGAVAGYAVRRAVDSVAQRLGRALTPRPKPLAVDPTRPFLVIGHRGSAATTVENTIPSMQRAIDDGANAVEIDLSLTSDGEVVLWHDWDPNDAVALARQVGLEPNVKYLPDAPALWSRYRRMAHELTLAELREHFGYKKSFFLFWKRPVAATIPTFADFLTWAASEPRLRSVLLDIKIPGDAPEHVEPMIGAMLREIADSDAACEFVFLTPHDKVLAGMKALAPDAAYSFDVEVPPGVVFEPIDYSATVTAERYANRCASVGRPALTLSAWKIYQTIIQHDVKHRDALVERDGAPMSLYSWTINNPAEARRLIDLGVDGILTDRPATLSRLARRRGLRVE